MSIPMIPVQRNTSGMQALKESIVEAGAKAAARRNAFQEKTSEQITDDLESFTKDDGHAVSPQEENTPSDMKPDPPAPFNPNRRNYRKMIKRAGAMRSGNSANRVIGNIHRQNKRQHQSVIIEWMSTTTDENKATKLAKLVRYPAYGFAPS